MRKVLIAAAVAVAFPAAAFPLSEDDKMMSLAFIEWAGINCGSMVPQDIYFKALGDAKEFGQETMRPYRMRVKAEIASALTREIACRSIEEAFTDAAGKTEYAWE